MIYMKTLVKILASLSAILALASCQQFKIDTQMTPEKAAANIRLVCDAVDAYAFPAQNPGTATFNISSNTPWTIVRSSGADWCDVTPSSSASSSLISDVVISVEPNTDDTDRSCTLTVKGENVNKIYTITIVQGRNGKLFVTPISQDFAACGGPLSFSILTNQPWEVRSDVNWISFNRESGEPDPEGRSITIIATAEPSSVLERVATITVIAGDDEESFDVSQFGSLSVTELSDPFTAAGGSQSFKIRTDLPWSIECDKTWLSFDKESGEGDGSSETITATATANDGASRTATVSILAGDASWSFEVSQKGVSFDIVPPESAELPRLGGEMTIEVDTSLPWEPETDVEGWSVEKIDATHFKVTAAFNNIFKPKSGKVAIVSGTNRAELELSQGINFALSGHYEVQEDGSIKIIGDDKTRVTTLDKLQYVSVKLTMKEVHFTSTGQLYLCTHDAGPAGNCEYQCQLNLAGNKRLRSNGTGTTYGSSSFSITEDDMNALQTFQMDFLPDAAAPGNIQLELFYNGTSLKQHSTLSCFTEDPETGGHYFFGCDSATSADNWYVVKTCDVIIPE